MKDVLQLPRRQQRWLRGLMILGCALVLSPSRLQGQGTLLLPILADDPDKHALVQGRVLDCEDPTKKNPARATIKVLRVYSGPKELLNSTFVDLCRDLLINDGAPFAWPPFSTDEKTSLWALSKSKDGWEVLDRYRLIPRSHGWMTDAFPQLVEQAEIVERMVKLSVAKRYAMAKELCEHQTPAVARFAVLFIAQRLEDKAKTPEALAFLHQLARNPRVGLHALVETDRLLLVRESENLVPHQVLILG